MTGIKTSSKSHLYTVMRRVGKRWERVVDAIFVKRSNARECCQELNAIAPKRKNDGGVRYRVAKMIIASQKP